MHLSDTGKSSTAFVVKLFGPQARLVGRREIRVEATGPVVTCAAIRQVLAVVEPRLADSLAVSRLAVNQQFADDATRVQPQDELALIGMISGG